MKKKTLFLGCWFIAFVLIGYSAASEVAVSAGGVNIHFTQQGEGEPALVFVHGWANTKAIWDDQMSDFAKKYTVIAVDLAGFGESGYNRTNWTMAAFGKDVAAVIKQLDLEKVVLVGFSMGGAVVIEAAKRLPKDVIGLVLVDNLQNIEMKYSPEMIAQMDGFLMDAVADPTNEKFVAGGFYKKDPEASFKLLLSMMSGQKNVSRAGWQESLDEFFRWSNEDCIESLKKVHVPIRAINSDSEPTNVEGFRKYAPTFHARIIPGAGHVLMWDAPEEFNRLLEESIQEIVNQSKIK